MEAPLGLYLQSMPHREIIARMLRNLKEIYRAERDWVRHLAVLERLVVLLPEDWTEYRDRGLAHAELGNLKEAADDLQCYLVHASDLGDLTPIADRLDAVLRASRAQGTEAE
jgi:regulator of sirC expression with transglutaminase-like and TPR domain